MPGNDGATGPAGPAPAGTGFVKVTNGVLDTPATTITPAQVAGTAVVTADSRLSDARTPLSHSHAEADVTNLVTDLAAKEKVAYAALANDTLAQNYAVNSCTKLTVTAARTLTTTVPPAGSRRTTIILTSGTTSFVITFGSGFKPSGTLATGTVSARVFVVNWISDGTNLYECSRTAALVA